MELKLPLCIIVSVVRQDIQECAHQIETLTCDVRNLEDWAYPLRHELSSGIDSVLPRLDEDWYFSRTRRLENTSQLGYCLFENLWWADIDFGNHNHHWHIQGQSNAKMLFAHTNKSVIGSYHEKAVVGSATEE